MSASRRSVYIFVNGILTLPGSGRNWNRRAVTWLHTRGPERACAESLEYFAAAILRFVGQRSRARKLATKISYYNRAGFTVHLVGHSNGCDVICDALRLDESLRVGNIAMIAGACEEDADRNGVNAAFRRGSIRGDMTLHNGAKDWALALASLWPARLVGYGALGRRGLQNLHKDFQHRLKVITHPAAGHGTFFDGNNFDDLMARLTQ